MDINKLKKIGKRSLPYVTVLFIFLVGYLLYESMSQIQWNEVAVAAKKVSWQVLLGGVGLSALNYLILTSYDYISFRFLKIPQMPYLRVLPSAFVCYAFNLNLGALIGGLGFRYRIYSGWKVARNKIPIVIFFSTLTNWSGYVLLLALVFSVKPYMISELIPLPIWIIQGLGVISLLGILAYCVFCFRRSQLKIRHRVYNLPPLGLALLQLCLSSLQWIFLSSIVYYFLIQLGVEVEFSKVLFTHLLAGIAGVITHIPSGLGVIEAIFLRMQFGIAPSEILVAVLCFRLVYYLIPLAFAIPLYLALEIYQKKNILNC